MIAHCPLPAGAASQSTIRLTARQEETLICRHHDDMKARKGINCEITAIRSWHSGTSIGHSPTKVTHQQCPYQNAGHLKTVDLSGEKGGFVATV